MSRLNVNSVNPHDGIKVSITGSTNGGLIVSASPASDANPVVQVHGSVSASGELTASNAFFSGNVHAVGNIYVEGHATFSAYTPGGIQLGDQNTDNVTFGADVNSHIIPNINNTYDLGSDAQEWRDIYIERTGYIDTIVQDDTSTTNTFKGDSDFMDDAGVISLRVNSADGNIGVKVSDPNVDFEVEGNMSSSGWLSLGGEGAANGTKGHLTASGNAIISGTLEVLGGALFSNVTASNISASNHLYGGLNTYTSRINSLPNQEQLLITTPVTASHNISSSGVLTGEGLYISDDAEIVDALTVGGITTLNGNITASGIISASNGTNCTHSLGGELHIADQVSIMDGGGQGRIGIGTLTPDATHRLHIHVHNSAAQSLLKFQTNGGTATHGIQSGADGGNHYIHSTKTNGALELGAEGTTMMHISASGKIITSATSIVSASNATGEHVIGGILNLPSTEDLADGGNVLRNVASSHFTTGGAETAALAAGTEGLVKVLAMKGDGGDMVVTVTNAGWKSSGTGTVTFDTIGDSVTLMYISGKWFVIGNNGATFA
jgi:hypothetical protein